MRIVRVNGADRTTVICCSTRPGGRTRCLLRGVDRPSGLDRRAAGAVHGDETAVFRSRKARSRLANPRALTGGGLGTGRVLGSRRQVSVGAASRLTRNGSLRNGGGSLARAGRIGRGNIRPTSHGPPSAASRRRASAGEHPVARQGRGLTVSDFRTDTARNGRAITATETPAGPRNRGLSPFLPTTEEVGHGPSSSVFAVLAAFRKTRQDCEAGAVITVERAEETPANAKVKNDDVVSVSIIGKIRRLCLQSCG